MRTLRPVRNTPPTAAQAAPFYFTLRGEISAADVAASVANNPLSSPSSELAAGSLFDPQAGQSFSFTLGLDNGGSSSLGQTWTAAHVVSMTLRLPTTVAGESWDTTLRFGPGAVPIGYLAPSPLTAAGDFATDADGDVIRSFSRLSTVERRGFAGFALTPDKGETNGPDLLKLNEMGLISNDGGKTTVLHLQAHQDNLITYSGTPVRYIDDAVKLYAAHIGVGRDAGLTDPANWSNDALLPPPVAAVPEPGTYALMALGLAALGLQARRRRTAA